MFIQKNSNLIELGARSRSIHSKSKCKGGNRQATPKLTVTISPRSSRQNHPPSIPKVLPRYAPSNANMDTGTPRYIETAREEQRYRQGPSAEKRYNHLNRSPVKAPFQCIQFNRQAIGHVRQSGQLIQRSSIAPSANCTLYRPMIESQTDSKVHFNTSAQSQSFETGAPVYQNRPEEELLRKVKCLEGRVADLHRQKISITMSCNEQVQKLVRENDQLKNVIANGETSFQVTHHTNEDSLVGELLQQEIKKSQNFKETFENEKKKNIEAEKLLESGKAVKERLESELNAVKASNEKMQEENASLKAKIEELLKLNATIREKDEENAQKNAQENAQKNAQIEQRLRISVETQSRLQERIAQLEAISQSEESRQRTLEFTYSKFENLEVNGEELDQLKQQINCQCELIEEQRVTIQELQEAVVHLKAVNSEKEMALGEQIHQIEILREDYGRKMASSAKQIEAYQEEVKHYEARLEGAQKKDCERCRDLLKTVFKLNNQLNLSAKKA